MIRFSLHYRTSWGESLVLRTSETRFPLSWAGDGYWEATLPGDAFRPGQSYSYEVIRDGRTVRSEWRAHQLRLPDGAGNAVVRDRWIDRPYDSAFWSSAFRDVVFGRKKTRTAPGKGRVVILAQVADIRPGEMLAVAGSGTELGDWKQANIMEDSRFPCWELRLDPKEPFVYKFVVADRRTRKILRWEEGPDRASGEIPGAAEALVVGDAVPRFKPRHWRGAGTAVPLFSLRSEESFGVGDFRDLRMLVDWAAETGQHFIQLLPVNDTSRTGTREDSYPYNAISSFALHPQFISLPEAGVPVDEAYRRLRQELNALPHVDYERVNREKVRLLREAFGSVSPGKDTAFRKFMKMNDSWLIPYAVFRCLSEETGTADFEQWGPWREYSRAKADEYAATHRDAVAFWCWVQYQLDRQLKEAVAYAHKKRVAIKGDLPIGVSRSSADVWTHPALFHLDMQAGAPPDAFSADGQNWGFPTYNWEKMAEDGYAWWKARLRKMGEYFDAYRIDHILGFFRIWEIPAAYQSGLMGHFSPAMPYSTEELAALGMDPTGADSGRFLEDPRRKGRWHPRIGAKGDEPFMALQHDYFYCRHNAFWRESALKKLPAMLRSAPMLSCGEDLGMIPACVPEVMAELNILSLEIQRMPKTFGETFADPARYPYFSVCTTGTHDTSTLRAWWEEDKALTQKYFTDVMKGSGQAPASCSPQVAEWIVRRHLSSPALLTILPLQDWLATDGTLRYPGNPADERINIPSNPRHYWRYRMHLPLETLLGAKAFNARLKAWILDAGRDPA